MKHLPNLNNMNLSDILVPALDHKEAEDDDCGLPENPIFTNYSKYLWQGHSENPRIRKSSRLTENRDRTRNFK